MSATDKSFKECPCCEQWFSLQDIIEDPTIKPLGLTFEESDLETNLFFFDHCVEGCGSTFMIPATRFRSVIDEPISEDIMAGRPECEGHCTRIDDWLECKNECFHAPFRRLLIRMTKAKGMTLPVDETRGVEG